MHLTSRSLPAVLVTILPLAAAVSPATSECVRSSTRRAVSASTCGDEAFLTSCLESLGDYFLQTDIEICYLDAGCGPDEAAASAIELLTACAAADEPEQQQAGDLRKRQRGGNNNDDDEEEDEDSSNDNADDEDEDADAPTPTRNQPNASPTDDDEDAETTDDAPTPEPTNEPVVVTKTDTKAAGTTQAAQTTATTTGTRIDPKDCTSSKEVTTTICTFDDNDDSKCTETVLLKPTCKDGLLCRMDASGVTQCMEARNGLTPGGVIVAIVFAVAVVVSIAFMTFFCCREKSEAKKLKAKMEAAAIAKASGVGKRNVSDRQPLMAQTQQEGYGGGGGGGGNGFDGPAQQGGPAEQNPFQDNQRF